ncbi:DUF6907 domain-containing protein [Streptomyces sp. NPDC093223]|uniref:DUF6907 domain-containing protein n=1 Tax=Streptomyces sp. NPDC093223 TaxID=3366033 RepID=UPI0037FE99AC
MTEPRHVQIETGDHGTVTVVCPSWCTGHDDQPHNGYRADIMHQGAPAVLTFDGEHLEDASLVQSPFAAAGGNPRLGGQVPGVAVSLVGETLNPQELRDFADALARHAGQLRALADQLAAILAGGEAR